MLRTRACLASLALTVSGCAGLEFHGEPRDDAFTYLEPAPFAVLKTAADCSVSVETLVLPGKRRSVRLKSGWGSSKLTLKTTNGMLTEIGQDTDTKIPETLTALTGLVKTLGVGPGAGSFVEGQTCTPRVELRTLTADDGGVRFSEPRLEYESVMGE